MRLVFMGTPGFAVPALQAVVDAGHDVALVVTREDKPRGRSGALVPPEVKVRAAALGLSVLQPRSPRPPEVLAAIAAARPDVLVVVAYGRILPRAVLDAAPLGAVNVHASILPAYRGAAPINWAIVHGEAETGVTIMQIDEGLDSGDVLAARRTPIGPRETAPELSARLSEMGATLLAETLPRIAAGACPRVPQEHARATRAPMLQKEDGILDWGLPATAIDARIRGFDPWPGVHTSWRGQSLAIHDALPGDGHDPGPVPGTVVAVEPAGLLVACGAGMLHVREVTPLGRRRMTARDFANGARLRPGDRFGA